MEMMAWSLSNEERAQARCDPAVPLTCETHSAFVEHEKRVPRPKQYHCWRASCGLLLHLRSEHAEFSPNNCVRKVGRSFPMFFWSFDECTTSGDSRSLFFCAGIVVFVVFGGSLQGAQRKAPMRQSQRSILGYEFWIGPMLGFCRMLGHSLMMFWGANQGKLCSLVAPESVLKWVLMNPLQC